MGTSGHRAENSKIPFAPRHARKPAEAPDRRALHYPGATLFEAGNDGHARSESDRDLDIDAEGVRLSQGGSAAPWSASWGEVTALSATDRRPLPDGRRGVVVTVTTGDGGKRSIGVPTRRPGAVAARIGATARRHRTDPDRPDRRVPLLIALPVVAVAAAAVAWLLLAAGHLVGL